MNEELKRYLDERFESIDRRFEVIDRRFETFEQRIEGKLDAVEDRMKTHVAQAIEVSETKLLGAFWQWARTADARYRQHNGEVFGWPPESRFSKIALPNWSGTTPQPKQNWDSTSIGDQK